MPGSHAFFHEYKAWANPSSGYVEYKGKKTLAFQALKLKAGQLVIWDSRTTHSRFRGKARADRYAALITFTQAQDNQQFLDLRRDCFKAGTGYNHHEAGLKATARPRYEKSLRSGQEQLSDLGRKLYGLDSWF